jgi:1-acyl-sn-glycerol-3-phosphate acyltransferase
LKKSPFLLSLMRLYVRRRIKVAFHDAIVSGINETRQALERGSIIVASNHVSWWDPLALILLDQALHADGYGLMAEATFSELPWFTRLGAIPLSKTSPRRALEQLDHAAALLSRKGRFVAIFPSGRQIPAHLPLDFQAGVLRLAERSQAPIVPLAIRYEFGEGPKPTLWLSLGLPQMLPPASRKARSQALENAVVAELSLIDEQLLRRSQNPKCEVDPGFVSLLHAAPRRAQAERIPLLARMLSSTAHPHPRHGNMP